MFFSYASMCYASYVIILSFSFQEGLVIFNEGADSDHQNGTNNRWPSVRNLLCLGISAIGALTLGAVLTKS